ncbi:MAG: gamma-glutamylcyclotransferase [Methylocystis sp.]|nr:gamma-glutamylcyclotransferase [Methylocystis sp.]
MPLYFAYGANMDASAMAARCPRSRLLGRARLARFRPFAMSCGYLSVAPDARAQVHGVLWDVPPGDVGALDRFEEVARGLYVKRVAPVLREPFGSTQALLYIGADPAEGVARPSYLAAVIAAAREHALPAAYINYLSSLSPQRKESRA